MKRGSFVFKPPSFTLGRGVFVLKRHVLGLELGGFVWEWSGFLKIEIQKLRHRLLNNSNALIILVKDDVDPLFDELILAFAVN